ncbi:hypothetical protein CUJ83_01020 [Methanocella sp. CWC-04]|uniref:Uncharacterized protein n=1 Tax=Methanooceanicella nereidis TaxID=2052831 RepID=A0AAP2W4Q3_9EURY|nr:hypothetical protein [Methanocella sp. CWC-04]MCD1293578.1 hypothetical protein [Methanocella sp. CWC-04]
MSNLPVSLPALKPEPTPEPTVIPEPTEYPVLTPTPEPTQGYDDRTGDPIIGTWRDKGGLASTMMVFRADGSFIWDAQTHVYDGTWEKIETNRYLVTYYDNTTGDYIESLVTYNEVRKQIYLDDTPVMFEKIA